MKRREFLITTAGAAGTLVPGLSFSQSKPCAPSPLSVSGGSSVNTVCVAGDSEADWIARATGAGVIWAHDFRHDAEVEKFLDFGSGGVYELSWRNERRDPDGIPGTKGGKLRAFTTGTTLAQHPDLPAGIAASASTMGAVETIYVANARELLPVWDGKQHEALIGTSKGEEWFTITAVDYDSNKLTVLRNTPSQGGPVQHAVGTNIGLPNNGNWHRPFAAFRAGQNGLPEDDVGIRQGHSRPHKMARTVGGPLVDWDVTWYRAHAHFVGGYFGHPEHQAEFPTYTQYEGALQNHTPNPWMVDERTGKGGDAFYLQFRVRFPASRFLVPDGKYFYLHTASESGAHQIYANLKGIANNRPAPPPGVSPPYYSLADFSTNGQAGMPGFGERFSETQSDVYSAKLGRYPMAFWDRENSEGSLWPKARWPLSQMDGQQAPCLVADRWITFLMYVKPGRHNCFPIARGNLAVEAAASGSTDQFVSKVIVTPDPGRSRIMAKFPKPTDIKPAVGTHTPTVYNRNAFIGTYGVGKPWGMYAITCSYGDADELMQVQDVEDNPDGTQTLTVLRNWWRNNKSYSSPIPVGASVSFGAFSLDGVPDTHPGYVRSQPHICPYQESHVKIWMHTEGEPPVYKKLCDKTDYVFFYGKWNGSKSQGLSYCEWDRNPPGFNSFAPFYYGNFYVGGQGAPRTTGHEYTQIILSRDFIPCPNDGF